MEENEKLSGKEKLIFSLILSGNFLVVSYVTYVFSKSALKNGLLETLSSFYRLVVSVLF